MAKVETIKKNNDFQAVFSSGQVFGNKHFVLHYVRNHKKMNRIGVIVSKKVSKKAVDRNRIRRQVKEIFRKNNGKLKQGYDLIVIAKTSCIDTDFNIMESSFMHLFYKKGLKQC